MKIFRNYDVQRVCMFCLPFFKIRHIGKVDGKTTNWDSIGLQKGKHYRFRVRAENPVGTSEDTADLDEVIYTGPATGNSFSIDGMVHQIAFQFQRSSGQESLLCLPGNFLFVWHCVDCAAGIFLWPLF